MPWLIEHQLEVLFARDGRGRLTATRNEPALSPRLFLGRSVVPGPGVVALEPVEQVPNTGGDLVIVPGLHRLA